MAIECGSIRCILRVRTGENAPYHYPQYKKVSLTPQEAHTAYANFLRSVRKLKEAKVESNWINSKGKMLSFEEFINHRNIVLTEFPEDEE
jgi:hypothetical protein